MSSKTLIWVGVAVGSAVGSWLPTLWGAGLFSLSSTIFGGIGSLIGIWGGFKLKQALDL